MQEVRHVLRMDNSRSRDIPCWWRVDASLNLLRTFATKGQACHNMFVSVGSCQGKQALLPPTC